MVLSLAGNLSQISSHKQLRIIKIVIEFASGDKLVFQLVREFSARWI